MLIEDQLRERLKKVEALYLGRRLRENATRLKLRRSG
jgi:hypothetical protein